MDLQLKGKTALVTGASMGIGRAIARALAAEGVRICAVARRKRLREEPAREITAAGGVEPVLAEFDFMPEELIAATPAKAALHAWSKGLSRAVGNHGVTVNCIQPGHIMSGQIRRKYAPEFRAKQSAEEIPVGRYGEPEELAVLAVFLASPIARYVTGTLMPVDGGLRRFAFQPV